MEPIVDEAAMCVVNIESVSRRVESMGQEEMSYVSDISTQFLTHLIRLAHCPDANKVKEAALSMLRLLLNNIFDNNSLKNKFVTYKSLKDIATTNNLGGDANANNLGETIVSSMLGSLNPVAILSGVLDDGTEAGDTLSKSVNGILSVLKGYNPLKIDDIIMLEICDGGKGCTACTSLKKTLANENPVRNHQYCPSEALLYFFRCMNHRRLIFGGDTQSARASRTFIQHENDPRVVIVPIRNMLLNCIDFLANDGIDRSLASICADFANEGDSYSDGNELWVRSLYEKVQRLGLQERAFIAQIYAFMMFSRHRQQSGDCIKQFLYTIFVRFLYSATEILFCANENASCEVDNGNLISYIEALTNTVVMGSTLNTMKAYLAWRNDGASAAPVMNLFSGCWKKNYGTHESLINLGVDMASYICELAKPSKLGARGGKKTPAETSGLDSIRSIRQAEKYIPFGFVEQYRGTLKMLPAGVSLYARNHSTGDNIPCNCFHILPCIKGGQALGPMGVGNQSSFEKVITPGDVDNGTGKVLGLITGYIDKTVLGTTAPANAADSEKRLNNFVKDIIFKKTVIHEDSVNQSRNMPHGSFWANPVMPAASLQTTARCFDTRMHTLFLVWQRPNVECPNVSALTASQLELMLSRDPKWAEFITRIYFNIERVSFQLADAIVKNMNEGDDGDNAGGGSIFKLVLPSHLKDANHAQKLIDISLGKVFGDWVAAKMTEGNGAEVTGVKAQYTFKLYQMLYDIVIKNDFNPSVLIAYSKFLCNYVKAMDELLMKILRSSTFQ